MSTTAIHTVLGAGPAGSTLAAELASRDLDVRLVNRSVAGPELPGVRRLAADLADPEATAAVVAGSAVVYHCVNVPYHHQVAEMPGLAASILAGARAAGARLVVLDTLYPYGEAEGERITEATPWAATSRKGRMRAELDQTYLDAHERGELPVAAGRSADFYGPGVLNSTLAGAVFPGALTGGPVHPLGDLDLPHSYTYVGDVARGLATLGLEDGAPGRIWHLPTVPARSTRAVLAEVEALVGRPLDVQPIAAPRPFGPFDETFMAEYAEMFYQHTTAQNMVSEAFEAAFGVAPTPFAEGLPQTVEWYRGLLAEAG